jgi:hypothetical protein
MEIANYAFRAIFMEPGRHTVEMRFVSPGWQLGLAMTLLTGAVLAAVLWNLCYRFLKSSSSLKLT